MYNYKLINNHYIVNISGYNFLIDTGSPFSFWISSLSKELIIDGKKYYLHNRPSNFDVQSTFDLVGVQLDGFIGMDIISNTGLTIHKDEMIEFKIQEIEGKPIQTSTSWPLYVQIGSNLMSGKFIIDTGAKYGYGVTSLFYKQEPFDHVQDYNPTLGHFDSDIYHINIVIGGQKKTIDVCNNKVVASTLMNMGAILIGNVSTLFENVCVLDTKKGRLILN